MRISRQGEGNTYHTFNIMPVPNVFSCRWPSQESAIQQGLAELECDDPTLDS
jgi:hypothetical protein